MKIVNVISKAPFVENYHVINLVTIKQIGPDIEMLYYYKIKELKDFPFKSSIYDKSIEEARKGTELIVEQLKKAMAKYRKKGGKDQNEQNPSVHDSSLNS